MIWSQLITVSGIVSSWEYDSSKKYINHACIYLFIVGLSIFCQVCYVNKIPLLWPGETQTFPGNAAVWATATEQWPLTSDWKLADWPVKRAAARKARQPRLLVSSLLRLLSCFHSTATLYPLATDHTGLHSSPHIWLQLNCTVVPPWRFPLQRARGETRL